MLVAGRVGHGVILAAEKLLVEIALNEKRMS